MLTNSAFLTTDDLDGIVLLAIELSFPFEGFCMRSLAQVDLRATNLAVECLAFIIQVIFQFAGSPWLVASRAVDYLSARSTLLLRLLGALITFRSIAAYEIWLWLRALLSMYFVIVLPFLRVRIATINAKLAVVFFPVCYYKRRRLE